MTEAQRRTLAAAMARILPSHGGPGAAETEAIRYACARISQSRFQGSADSFYRGLDMLDSLAQGLFGASLPECRPDQQDAVLRRMHDVPHPTTRRFLLRLVNMTIAGFLCPPAYGGNRNGAGWRFIAFSPHPQTYGTREIGA